MFVFVKVTVMSSPGLRVILAVLSVEGAPVIDRLQPEGTVSVTS